MWYCLNSRLQFLTFNFKTSGNGPITFIRIGLLVSANDPREMVDRLALPLLGVPHHPDPGSGQRNGQPKLPRHRQRSGFGPRQSERTHGRTLRLDRNRGLEPRDKTFRVRNFEKFNTRPDPRYHTGKWETDEKSFKKQRDLFPAENFATNCRRKRDSDSFQFGWRRKLLQGRKRVEVGRVSSEKDRNRGSEVCWKISERSCWIGTSTGEIPLN